MFDWKATADGVKSLNWRHHAGAKRVLGDITLDEIAAITYEVM